MSRYGVTGGLRLTMGPNLKQKPNRVIVQSLDSSTLSNTLQQDPVLQEERRSLRPPDAQKVKIGIYFASWWALNVVFNIYNKKVLNTRVPLPMAYLAIVFFYHAGFDFWKALARVAVTHTIGHVPATVSMSKVVVSFTHIIKSAELGNKISVAFSWFLYVLFKIRVYVILAITAKNIIYLLFNFVLFDNKPL